VSHTSAVIKLELLFSVIVFAVWVYTLVDVVTTPTNAVRNLPKVAWVILVLLFPLLGTAGWFIFGRPEGAARRSAHERATPEFPEYDRPGRAAAADPAKDEEFLRQIRAKAEEQRRRYEQSKKAEAEREAQQKQKPQQPEE
jgi:hypothetical protein